MGGLVYADGANLNAVLGVVRPAGLGFDMMQVNLNKTFATPHGTNGPGAGPLLASETLAPYLPGPVVEEIVTERGQTTYKLSMPPKSIGRLTAGHGNFGVLLRAFSYIAMLGEAGLREVALNAVLNTNYLKTRLAHSYPVPYSRSCMHEFVIRGDIAPGVETMDVAKRLIDYGFHPPIVYFPLIVNEAMLIEPAETESRETLDAFAEAMINIVTEARQETDLLLGAPHTTPVSRLDQVAAARRPRLVYKNQKGESL